MDLQESLQFALLKAGGSRKTPRMPEADHSMFQILFPVVAGMLALILLLCWRISRRLAWIEKQFKTMADRADPQSSAPSHAETQAGGAFETFLNEDPSRRLLTKAEQFAAYRKWRQDKGLNWSGS